MKKTTSLLLALVIQGVFVSLTAQNQTTYWQQHVDYTMDVTSFSEKPI